VGLADNGGPTQTMALGAGSAALDKTPTGSANCPASGTDQRGFPRPSGPACDIGAFEVQVPVQVPQPPPTAGATGSVVPTAQTTKRRCKRKHKRSLALAAKKCHKRR
jgi:hypothetical protein